MSTKHTAGPWKNHGRQPNTPGLPHSAVAGRTLLARVYSEAYGDVKQEKANADLIAAAPELLEALQELVGWQTCAPEEAVAAARAAIAKATGGKL